MLGSLNHPMDPSATIPAPQAVIGYWFGAQTSGFSTAQRRQSWFDADSAADAEIAERFERLIEDAAGGRLDGWLATPPGIVAFVLVCDQFSRQVYRGTVRAYATDTLALEVARRAIEAGQDAALGFDERAFLYMPFQHAESRVDQHTAVGLFAALRDATPPGQRHLTGNFLRHAQQHRDIVLRFGRFPHRNAVLGRDSTAEELRYLKTAPHFGQTT
jgi:uncharacterized protein (DUF924 family)